MENRMECFAVRLREMRLANGMTQRELGERLGFSEKTVSKWECGAAIPDVETLFALSALLGVAMESLFSTGEQYFLGIDGGGTKTALLLVDSKGKEVRSLLTEGCNPVDLGVERAIEILRGGIYEVCAGIPLSSVCAFAGIAGGSTGGMKERLKAFFASLGFCAFENDSDNRSIVAAGLGAEDGITAVMGTGFCVYTQKDGSLHRSSGWGYLIDDGGSGYNLGREALLAYFSAYDGTGEPTLLCEEIDRLCPGGEEVLITNAYRSPKRAIAALAPAVFAAKRRGDPVAARILERNMQVAARIIAAAANRFPKDRTIPVVLAGGLTDHCEIKEGLHTALANSERYAIKVLDCAPVEGAVMLAKMRMGGNYNE